MPIAETLNSYALRQASRILTQLDRDPHSPTVGCFDRNYWHYKMRDFPSSILQQGTFLLEALRRGQLEALGVAPDVAARWTVQAVNALSRQVDRRGRVDEYYPYEESYPAAAFGIYAVTRILLDWQEEQSPLLAEVEWRGLRKLAMALARRVELQASNQFAIGVAAVAMAQKIPQLSIAPEAVAHLSEELFNLQHEEGWFPEYGGPDFGYLAVTLDALADYAQVTQDNRAHTAAAKAIAFMHRLVGADGQLPWTLNSRNTDYITPYGLAWFGQHNRQAAALVQTLFAGALEPNHFLAAVDDRYHCHYVYASLVRSLPLLNTLTEAEPYARPEQYWLPGCGYWVTHTETYSVYAGAYKGGLVRVHQPGRIAAAEYGWRVRTAPGKLFVSNWWTHAWQVTFEEASATLTVAGPMVAGRFQKSTPLRHGVLRALAFVLHRRLMPLLKRVMIFRPQAAVGPAFQRKIELTEIGVQLSDTLAAVPGATAVAAPRQNLRHVASADSFHVEEGQPAVLTREPALLETGVVHHQLLPIHDEKR